MQRFETPPRFPTPLHSLRETHPQAHPPKHTATKGELLTGQHTPFNDPLVRRLLGGQEISGGFSGTLATRPKSTAPRRRERAALSFHAVLKLAVKG
jgi:hypothetical protein